MKQMKINSSLSRRFSLSTIMVVASILLVTCIIAIAYSVKNSEADMKTRLDNTIRMAQATITYSLWNVQDDVVKAQTEALSNEKGIAFIEIRDEDCNPIAKKPETEDFSSYEKNKWDYLAGDAKLSYFDKEGEHKVGSLRVAIDKKVFRRELFTSILLIIGVTLVIIIAISITSIVITKRHIFQPLSKLEASARLISEGNLETVIDTDNEDEIGKLAKSFDDMRLSIKKLVEDLKNSNQRLDDSNKTLEVILDNITRRVYWKNLDGLIIGGNRVFAGDVGLTDPEELKEKRESDLWKRKEVADLFEQMTAEISKTTEPKIEITKPIIDNSGALKWLTIDCTPLTKSGDKITSILFTYKDVTAQKQAEDALRNSKCEAENARDIAEKTNQVMNLFIANMSHDIRTPMHNILGYVDLLEKLLKGEQEKNYISVIKSNSNLLLQLLNSILDLSKIRAGKLELINEPVDIRATFADVNRSFLIRVDEKNLDFNLIIDHVFPQFIYLDGARLRQVLMNLVGNAVKFTESGQVTLAVKLCSTREEDSTIDFTIIVKDTGRGIEPGKIKEIFEPFAQENGSISYNYGGSGLGLSISKGLVELMGGTIRVESEPGKGSLFRIDFKNVETKVKETESAEKQPLADIDSIIFKKKTILVVEDNHQSREFLRQYLEAYTLEVIEAEDGKQGVEYAKKYHPDLIIMDMKMPVMSGFEAVKTIKADEELKAIPIIALTAHALKEEEEEIMTIGCNDFLRKPASRSQLVMKLTKHLPYTRKESVESAPPVSPYAEEEFVFIQDQFPAIARENIGPLIEILEKNFMGKWQDIQKSLIIKDAKNLALDIKKLGTNSGAEILINWADRILTDIQLVNINKIASAISVFPKIVEDIKSNQGGKNE